MNDDLATYLKDHMAGAQFAMSLLQHLHEAYADEPLGDFAIDLLRQIESDFEVLRTIAAKLETHANPLKQAAAWFAEKASHLKLSCAKDNPLGTFEAIEFLSLGVLGKLKLWQVLTILAVERPELQRVNYSELAARAQAQHDELECHRRDLARIAFITERRSDASRR
jgi:hypothetical protein